MVITREDKESGGKEQKRLEEIEKLLDNSVRPYMWDDGGDVELLRLEKQQLHMQFVGACRECPHADTSTFEAIRAVVKRYDPDLELINDTPRTKAATH